MIDRKLRAGIVGGGRGAFIGAVHRIAAELDNEAEVVAGALSRDPAIARESAREWHLLRSYDSYEEMAEAEARRQDGIDFVIVATPNYAHFPVIKAFARQGIHVVCDKPLAMSSRQGQEIKRLIQKKRLVFALTHNYTGYPLVRQAREMVQKGELGTIRKVIVEYLQDWLMQPLERTGQKQAAWRTDPRYAGISCCIGDIGTHGENLLTYITGLRITAVAADTTTFVPGRRLEDDANILLRLENGAKGVLVCSQVAAGEENALSIRIYGTKAGLEWHQQEPNVLILKRPDAPNEILRPGRPYLSPAAKARSRLPAGHPEAFLEAFANIYRAAIRDIRAALEGKPLTKDYPTVDDGIRGIRFVEKCIASANRNGRWTKL